MQTATHQEPSRPGRRLVLQVRWGRMAHQRRILGPGQVIRVGRAQAMDLSIPHDVEMSHAHFELAWDGAQGHLQDLKSTAGTLLGGERVDTGVVSHGAWIRAGTTDFSVYFEGTALPVPLNEATAQALAVLRAQENLFAVLDMARSPRVLELLQESTEEYLSLYEGPQGEALADVAPYLVRLTPGSKLLERLLAEGWGQSWGIYFTCPLAFLETRRHLRKFLMVESEGMRERMYFRFYDPRVLHVFLPTCTPAQKREFLGLISGIFHEVGEELVSVPADNS